MTRRHDDYLQDFGMTARECKLAKRRNRMPVHGRGVLTLNDLIERRKLAKPTRGGKREIVVREDDSE